MAILDQKKDVFTTIGAYTSLEQSGTPPNTTNIFPSVNNKKDIVPFLLDVLKVVVGTDALQELTGKIFTDLVPKMNKSLQDGVKKQMTQSNAGNQLPNDFVTNGYTVKVKDIDVFGKLKTNPSSTAGNLLYSNSPVNFDNSLYSALLTGSASFGGVLSVVYNAPSDSFNFKPINSSVKIGDFLNGFVDKMEIINPKEFMSSVMNAFYGSITSNQNKTVEQVAQELAVMKQLEQLINDNSTFVISPQDYDAILQKAQELVNGVTYYDLGCGVMEVVYPLSGMSKLIASISGSTDPFFVGNQVANTIAESTQNTPEATSANKQSVKDGFFQRLITIITQILAQAITSTPQIRTLLAISSAFTHLGVPQIGNPLDDLKKFKIFLKCNLNVIMAIINKFIYDLIILVLTTFLIPIIKMIVKEKINQYVKQQQSLIAPGIDISD